MVIKKQFIAGAVCPKCSEMDSLVLFSDDQRIECVSCDFKQSALERDEKSKTKQAVGDIEIKPLQSLI